MGLRNTWWAPTRWGDLLARIRYGGRITLVVGLAAMAVSATVGIALGLMAGYYRGAADEVIMRLADVRLAVPVLILAVTLIALLDITVVNIVLVLGLGGWVTYARVVKSLVLSLNEREFIQGSRALGASDLRILLRHILPNVASAVWWLLRWRWRT